ncbi:helix-turn-helix transcriptional regulator [Yinghuangia sp. KLBMP8922]|uniref:Helix-turn-helix transcriptional regulator n=2 Tax=Yinghuangia soli TaxID=2908204 RepID=A0AA41Q9K7_9ACTN|nr:helix-turn-helix transcriptional regulator [Yinghuangia soli]
MGRYDSALERLESALTGPGAYRSSLTFAIPDLVEAAVRAGRPERAASPFVRFAAWAEAAPTPWAKAVALRCRALLSAEPATAEPQTATESGETTEALFSAAITAHTGSGRPFEQARTELLFGEWLRRSKRRTDARSHLRSAAARFDRLGATPWAERARTELRAAGEAGTTPLPLGLTTAPAESAGAAAPTAALPLDALTPQELQVVRLAAAGASNQDIAAQLFLSRRTVEYHLYKAYPKLGIGSRRELVKLALATGGTSA